MKGVTDVGLRGQREGLIPILGNSKLQRTDGGKSHCAVIFHEV
jgi:hypothetical protein